MATGRNTWRENNDLARAYELYIRDLTHHTVADLLAREEQQEAAYAARLARRLARFDKPVGKPGSTDEG